MLALGIGLGASLKKDIWVDSRCVGDSAPDVFFYTADKGNAVHKVSTESEFLPNVMQLGTESGQHYLIKQYLKPNVFVGGTGLGVMLQIEGKAAIGKLDLAQGEVCGK